DHRDRMEQVLWCQRRQQSDGAAERSWVGDADETRPARRNHFSCGRRRSVWISVLAFTPSIRAPAAADDASHARSMLAASVASRRMLAAFCARFTALMNTACASTSSSGG